MKSTRLYRAVAFALIFAGLAGIPAVCAAGDQLDELQNEVNMLMHKVESLNARLHVLEEQRRARESASARQSSTPGESAAPKPTEKAATPQSAEKAGIKTNPAVADTTAERAPVKGAKPATLSLDQAWKSLSKGMSAAEVHKLLGEPTYRLRFSPNTVWYYTYHNIGSGSITMSPEGRIIDWQHPPHVGGWW